MQHLATGRTLAPGVKIQLATSGALHNLTPSALAGDFLGLYRKNRFQKLSFFATVTRIADKLSEAVCDFITLAK